MVTLENRIMLRHGIFGNISSLGQNQHHKTGDTGQKPVHTRRAASKARHQSTFGHLWAPAARRNHTVPCGTTISIKTNPLARCCYS